LRFAVTGIVCVCWVRVVSVFYVINYFGKTRLPTRMDKYNPGLEYEGKWWLIIAAKYSVVTKARQRSRIFL